MPDFVLRTLRGALLAAALGAALLGCGCRARAQAGSGRGVQAGAQPQPGGLDLRLPLLPHSVRFGVIGDSGTGAPPQYEIAREMNAYRQLVKFPFVIMLGDNIYGGHRPADFTRKFEQPYQPLLAAGVKFYASLGNHDDPGDERLYKPFNMGGQRYYSFHQGNVDFFALDSNYMDPKELTWIQSQLATSTAAWKICFFHHPLFSDGKFHGSDLDLRARLMPLFVEYGVNAVFSGHDHVYERVRPQQGIYFFVEGDSGQLRYHNLRRGKADEAAGSDTEQDFMLVEVAGDQLYFQTVNRDGKVVDAGHFQRQAAPAGQGKGGAQ